MDLSIESDSTVYVVLTHQPCRDGLVASMCARKYYTRFAKHALVPMFWGVEPSKQVGDIKSFMEKIKANDPENKIRRVNIESFDIAFNPETIINMINHNSQYQFNIRIMDHHKSSLDSWKTPTLDCYTTKFDANLLNVYKRVMKVNNNDVEFINNMEECGASLAWKYYFPNEQVPLFIKYVRDRDNWLFDTDGAKARNSMEVNEYLMGTSPKYDDYLAWFAYFDKDATFFEQAYQGGKTLLNAKNNFVNMIMGVGTNRKIGEHTVFVCNAPILMSDVGNTVCDKYNLIKNLNDDDDATKQYLCDYAMIWRYDEKCRKYCVSLRSRKGGVDVQEIAKKYNGGGHINASGFETDNINFLNLS